MSSFPSAPAFSTEEKSSLSQVVARLGRPATKESRGLTPSSIAKPGSGPTFTPAQAHVLVEALLERLGLAGQANNQDCLLRALTALPCLPGPAVDVLAAHADYLREIIRAECTGKSGQPHADRALRLLGMAVALKEDPSLQPWCDIAALDAEQARLAQGTAKDWTDNEKESARFLRKVEESGLLRKPCPVPDPGALLKLVERFPNFEAPLRFLAEQAAFALLRGNRRFCPAPILLTGPAGVGKTHFALALAELLQTHTEVLSMASQTCGFGLSGMDRGWSSARCGLVFEALLHGDTLSPVVVLDELDKANSDARSDPLGPLYSLLEPRTARAFHDEYAGLAIDASQVVWIATANDTTRLPAPVLSRFTVFEIAQPTAEQMAVIAESVFEELAGGLPGVPDTMPQEWHQQCAGLSVRSVRLVLQRAIGQAALHAFGTGQRRINLNAVDLGVTNTGTRKRIGFY